eukprot:TRINITY_DN8902_c0_g2_i1.p1 TRINITY_DN8902_c0_g2~~TRINITY_DN8902_c0_g2_i1.p1  ORF type:complete len:749 (+),score=144.01 TRINITY_DN8902_c0_g2_i1:2003-4249(+)
MPRGGKKQKDENNSGPLSQLQKLRKEYEECLAVKQALLNGEMPTEEALEKLAKSAMLQFQIKQLEAELGPDTAEAPAVKPSKVPPVEPEEQADTEPEAVQQEVQLETEEEPAEEPAEEAQVEVDATPATTWADEMDNEEAEGAVESTAVVEEPEEAEDEEEEELAPPPKPKPKAQQKETPVPKPAPKPVAKRKPAEPMPIPFTFVRYSAEKDKEPPKPVEKQPKPEPEIILPLVRAKRNLKKREYTILQRTAVNRLLRELKDLQRDPLPHVSALPTEHDILEWHVNVAPGGIFAGCILHLVFSFGDNYPFEPPKVKISHDLVQLVPCVVKSGTEFEVCLDICKTDPGFRFSWNSSYTVTSLCMQLQTFFETEATEQAKRQFKGNWLAAVEAARKAVQEFTDPDVNHTQQAPWPPIEPQQAAANGHAETPAPQQNGEKAPESWDSHLFCYFTRLTYKESVLGIGLHVERSNTTVEDFSSGLDLISQEAFDVEKLRRGTANDKFEHFLPLPLTLAHCQKALPLIERAFAWFPRDRSLLYEPPFRPASVVRLLPLLMHSLVAHTLTNVSKGALAQQFTDKLVLAFYQLHYTLLELAEKHAVIAAEAQKTIQQALDGASATSPAHDLLFLALLSDTPWQQFVPFSFKHYLQKTRRGVVRDVFHGKDVRPSLPLRSLLVESLLVRTVSSNTLEHYRGAGENSVPAPSVRHDLWEKINRAVALNSWEAYTEEICSAEFTADSVMGLVDEHSSKK